MELRKFIATTIREYLNEQISSNNLSDYVGQHSAPTKDDFNEPMYNIKDMFPDIYSENALRYYGGYGLDDNFVINQIQSVKNKPKASIIIYRAVPNLNKDIDKEIKELIYLVNYHSKYRFFPVNNDIINELEKEVWDNNPSLKYDEMQNGVLDELNNKIDELRKQKEKPIKINNGDWVTTSKMYAIQHGQSHLNNNYKIVTKTVKASQLYTDGNSIFEWGYSI
jgi:hypothetical protein